jgi:hypothetical protein
MAKLYSPVKSGVGGRYWKISIPSDVKPVEHYRFEYLPDGTLIYTPVKTL